MLHFLDQLRQKPLYVREQIAFGVTLLFAFIIGSIWWNSWTVTQPDASVKAPELSPTTVVASGIVGMKDHALSLWNTTIDQLKRGAGESLATSTPVAGESPKPKEADSGGSQTDIVYPEQVFSNPYTATTTKPS